MLPAHPRARHLAGALLLLLGLALALPVPASARTRTCKDLVVDGARYRVVAETFGNIADARPVCREPRKAVASYVRDPRQKVRVEHPEYGTFLFVCSGPRRRVTCSMGASGGTVVRARRVSSTS